MEKRKKNNSRQITFTENKGLRNTKKQESTLEGLAVPVPPVTPLGLVRLKIWLQVMKEERFVNPTTISDLSNTVVCNL